MSDGALPIALQGLGLGAAAQASVVDLPYVSAASLLSMPATRKVVRFLGYAASSDGGGALYKRVTAEPSHSGKFRSTDRFLPDGTVDSVNGGWWSIAENIVNVKMFGATGDGEADDTGAFNAALSYLTSFGTNVSGGITYRPELFIPAGVYSIGTLNTIENTSRISIRGAANFATKLRMRNLTDGALFRLGQFQTSPASAFGGGAQGFELRDMIITNDWQNSIYGISGVASAGTSTTLVDAAQGMSVNAHNGCNIFIYEGTGAGQLRTVSSNTSTTFTVSSAWTTTPDATSKYVTSPPQRVQMALQDNGCGGLIIERVQVQGFRYGFCLSYGSDFDVFRDVRIRNCDVGMYIGPGSQQHIHEQFDIGACGIGLVVDALKHAKFITPIFTQNGTDILFETTSGANTRLGVTAADSVMEKNYQGVVEFDTPWFETGAGESVIPVPYHHASYVEFASYGANNATTRNVVIRNPYVVDGVIGMPSTIGSNKYAFVNAYWAANLIIERPVLFASRLQYVVANENTSTFPFIRVIDPRFVNDQNKTGFSRVVQNTSFVYSQVAESSGVIAQGVTPIQIGGMLASVKQTDTQTTRTFNTVMPNGVYLVCVRVDKSDYTKGTMITSIVWYDKNGIMIIEQIGSTHTYGSGPPTVSCALAASNVFQTSVSWASSTSMVCSVSMTELQPQQTFP